jgi:hypothetical protein
MSGQPDTIEGALLIPILQSCMSGTLAGALGGSAATVYGWDDPAAWAVLGGIVTALLTWIIYRGEWRHALNVVLGVTQPDETQPTVEYPQVTRIEVISQDPQGAFMAGVWCDIDLPPEQVSQAARRVRDTGSFSHATLAGPGRPLTRSEYETLRDAFISRGLVTWINPGAHAQGLTLTAAGRAAVRRLAETPSPITKGGPRLTKI